VTWETDDTKAQLAVDVRHLITELGPTLADFAMKYFTHYTELDPLAVDIFVGVYTAYDREKRRPKQLKPEKVSRSFPLRYFVAFDPKPLAFEVGGTPPADPDHPDRKPLRAGRDYWWYDASIYEKATTWRAQHLVSLAGKGDAVIDDDAELTRSGVPLHMLNLTELGAELRTELYGGNLDEIEERPNGVAEKYEGSFLRTLATEFTYDDAGNYFSKWKDDAPRPANRYDALTDKYIERWFQEILLQEKSFHLYVHDPDSSNGTIFRFDVVNGVPKRTYVAGEPAVTLLRRADILEDKRVEAREKGVPAQGWAGKKTQARWQLYFFHTLHGVKDKWKPAQPRTFSLAKDRRASRMVVDPKQLVLQGKDGDDALANALGLGGDFDWFVELVAQKFPFRFYAFDLADFKSRWASSVVPSDRHPVYLRDPLRDAARKALEAQGKGPLALIARVAVELQLKRDDILLFPQGLEDGGTKFIGFADSMAWMRNLKTGHVEVMPQDDYVMALAMGKFWGDIAKDTAWIIPVATFMAYAALFAVSFGTSAGAMTLAEVSATGVRSWLTRKLATDGAEKALKAAALRLSPVILAAAVDLVTRLFDDPKKKDELSDRWRAFAHGFFDGYLVQTIYDHLYKKIVLKTLTEGPKEVRTIVAVRKIYLIIDKVHGVVKKLDEELDDAAMAVAKVRFAEMVTHVIRGCSLLLSALYFLPHDEAGPALELLGGGGPDGGPPDRGQWEAEAGAALESVAKHISGVISSAGDVTSTVDSILGVGKPLLVAGGLLAAFPVLLKPVAWVGKSAAKPVWSKIKARKKTFIVLALGAVGGLAVAKRDDLPTIDEAGELLKDLGRTAEKVGAVVGDQLLSYVAGLPGRTEAEAEVYGKLVGNLLGGFILDRDRGKLKEKLLKQADKPKEQGLGADMKDAFLSKTFDKNVKKHGIVMPIIKLLFHRYLSLYDQMVKRNILGAARGEGEFAAIFSDVQQKELEGRGLGRLMEFKTQDETGMTLKSLGMAALKLHHVLGQDLKAFLEAKYAGNLTRYKEDLQAMAALSGQLGLTEISEQQLEMVFHHLTAQLGLALRELTLGLQAMVSPFKKDGHFSWVALIEELGLDLGETNLLRKTLLDPRAQELSGFQQKAAPAPAPAPAGGGA
jgi:hypothetical protein